jgi:hypothetical protein
MAMTYNSLTAAKGTSGAVATWVAYTKLDIPVIVDEAQALIYMALRCREMLTDLPFTMTVGQSYIALPARFLDPIGRIQRPSINLGVRHKDSNFIQTNRNYTETSGTLGTNPFTTTNGSTSVAVNLPGHGFNQDSIFNTSGADLQRRHDQRYVPDRLDHQRRQLHDRHLRARHHPKRQWCRWWRRGRLHLRQPRLRRRQLVRHLERAHLFRHRLCADHALQAAILPIPAAPLLEQSVELPHQPLSAADAAGPHGAAADFMQDTEEFQKHETRLVQMIQAVSVENDMMLRGMELDTEIP